MLTNRGQPIIEVTQGNYENRGQLYLLHRFDGVGLDIERADETLRKLYKIWTRPVHLETIIPQYDERGQPDGALRVRRTCDSQNGSIDYTVLERIDK